MNNEPLTSHRERIVQVLNGWVMLPTLIGGFFGAWALLIYSIAAGVKQVGHPIWPLFIPAVILIGTTIVMLFGFFTLQPNEARVLILFGAYKGTVKDSGFHW